MIADMTVPELNELSALIETDIVKYIDEWARKSDLQEWSTKIKLIAEQLKTRKILKLEFEAA